MKNRKTFIYLGIIVVLALIYIISKNINTGSNVPKLKTIDKVDELEITKDKEAVKLKLKNDQWFVSEEFPADKTEIEKLVNAFKDLKLSDLITKGAYDRYDLSQEKAIQVTAKKEGKVLRDVLIGKNGSTGQTSYIKFADKEEVYLALGNLKSTFTVTADKLRDKKIYDIEKNDISWFQVNYKSKVLSFEKKTETVVKPADANKPAPNPDQNKDNKPETVEKWICKEQSKAEISKNKVDSFLNSLHLIRAESFPELKKDDLKNPVCVAKAKIADKEITLNIYKKSDKDKEDYYCTSSESPYVFVLREYIAKRFFKELSDFQDVKK